MDNSKIIKKFYEDSYDWNRNLSNLEEVLLKKRETKYKDLELKYEKEIEQAKVTGNVEEVEKKYESIGEELYNDYFYLYSIIYLDSKYKTLKDLLKWKKEYKNNLKKDEELKGLFEDSSIHHTSKIIEIYTKYMHERIEITSIYKKARLKRKIEKLSEFFNKEIEQKNLTKKEKEKIIEKYDKKMKKIQDSFIKDYAKIIRDEEKLNNIGD